MKTSVIVTLLFLTISEHLAGQAQNTHGGGTPSSPIASFRLPLPVHRDSIQYLDLDNDGDPDVLRAVLSQGIRVQWIDDDDDMRWEDIEGDLDSDCLMIDRNRDGAYGSQYDLIVDRVDETGDGKADLQCVVDYSGFDDRGQWQSHYWWFVDSDSDGVFNVIDWNTLTVKGWDHAGQARFFADYHGKSAFLKAHTNTFNIRDLRYNWENPFLFFDPDDDGQSEMAIRYVDSPVIVSGLQAVPPDGNIRDDQRSLSFTGRITDVRISIDLDNDSRPGNELDYDLSIKLTGRGFDYSDHVHRYRSLRGLPDTDTFFYDPRWRRLNELAYVDHDSAYAMTFQRGVWDQCWFTFDEDDDCHRWERVELYEPRDPFAIGALQGGLDHNPQADVSGDRGEWDMDFSGHGNLYVGAFDGRIHLFGAEWGAWRIDQNASYYQGWQGWRGKNLQPEDRVDQEPDTCATVLYADSDGNGYFDVISYDLDGDRKFERVVSLTALGISDRALRIDLSKLSYAEYYEVFFRVASAMWDRAQTFVALARAQGLAVEWYAHLLHPGSLQEKYQNGYWLRSYLYDDLRHVASLKEDDDFCRKLDIVYFGGDAEGLQRR
jgi:hypothetical protein